MRCSIVFVAALVTAWSCALEQSSAQAPGAEAAEVHGAPQPPAAAQPPPPPAQALDSNLEAFEYDEAIRVALQEFKLEHWAEARISFSRAHAIRPNARTLRGLGLTCFQSRRYVDSIEYIEQALVHRVQPLTPQMRQDLERVLVQARQFVTPARLMFSADSADVQIDDKPSRPLARDSVVLLDPGAHEIHVTASGFETATRNLIAEGSAQIDLRFALTRSTPSPGSAAQPTPVAALPPPALIREPEPRVPPSPPAEKSDAIAPWILVAASGAVAVTGGVLLGVAFANKSDVEHPDSKRPVWSEYRSSYDSGKVFFPLSAALIAVGVAGIGAGLAWKFWPEAESSPSLAVEPGGLRVSGHL
jgi:hypothetical protein